MCTVADKIANMSNRELYEVAKAFSNCGKRKACDGCPCDGVLCSHYDFIEARDLFIGEIGKREIMIVDEN